MVMPPQAIKHGMRKSLLVLVALTLPALSALAEQPGAQKYDRTATGKQLPLKRATSANSCAAFGAGFVMIEGTNTCVKIGGVISTGASAYMGAR
jgi:hypothetical protein